MSKKIRFLAYDTANGIKMEEFKEEFKRNSKTKEIQKEIDEIRSRKPEKLRLIDEEIAENRVACIYEQNLNYFLAFNREYRRLIKEKCALNKEPDIKKYRNDIHIWKEKRQLLWVDALINKVIQYFDKVIEESEKLPVNDQVNTYVLMLPEFFWADISDGVRYYDREKNGTNIIGYTAPLYDIVYAKLADNDALREWMMAQKKNILFFAGTVMHKKIMENPMDEKIYNTLLIFGWDVKKKDFSLRVWNKINYSSVDGFNLHNYHNKYSIIVRLKNPHNEKMLYSMTDKPLLTFDEIDYSYDICLDYIAMGNYYSISNKLNGKKADFNILIAGGMSIKDFKNPIDTIDRKSSDRVVRCDKVRFKDNPNMNINEECCSLRVGENVQDMKAINDTCIRYVDFEVAIENGQKNITRLS